MHVIVAGKEERRGREVIASFWAESGPDSGSDSALTPVRPPAHFLFLDLPSLSSMGSYIRKGMQIDMEIFTEVLVLLDMQIRSLICTDHLTTFWYANQIVNIRRKSVPSFTPICKSAP